MTFLPGFSLPRRPVRLFCASYSSCTKRLTPSNGTVIVQSFSLYFLRISEFEIHKTAQTYILASQVLRVVKKRSYNKITVFYWNIRWKIFCLRFCHVYYSHYCRVLNSLEIFVNIRIEPVLLKVMLILLKFKQATISSKFHVLYFLKVRNFSNINYLLKKLNVLTTFVRSFPQTRLIKS